ncbi:DEAD/DEAH box helicase [Methylocella tundrae]|uniref:DEAD/DEAH box helicase n=1 Tax=Methylocella tundrae TaxID=227605 RepID=UPI00157AA8D7|nr:DEAD/DEAH box helicase [Methylocella tundrae]
MPPDARKIAKGALRLALYQQEPEAWARLALGLKLDPWQRKLVETPRRKRAIALVHRQAGKTTAAAIATAHHLKFGPAGSTSLVLAPTQRQSGEAIRRIRGFLLHAGAKLAIDNAFSLQLENGSRVLGLPGQDDAAIRGLTVDGVMVVDEAARVSDALFQAAMPMVLRHARTARVMLLSTAWAKEGFFYRLWSDGDQRDWLKIEARIDECTHLTPADVERERRAMPATVFAREYLNIFDSLESRFFAPDAIAAAFGDVQGPMPEAVTFEGNEADPILARTSAFARNPFATGVRF